MEDIEVDVYFNVTRKVFSIRQDGIVIAHRSNLFLTHSKFIVRESGQKRVRETGHKNVHAFVRGMWDQKDYHTFKDLLLWRRVSYNPKRDNFFMVQNKFGPSKYEEVKRDFTYAVALETENGKPITRI